jgi:Zn-dependent protease with chaperone function
MTQAWDAVMNFFERQEQSRQKTFQLILLFILADIGVVLSVYFVAIVAVNYYANGAETSALPRQWMDPLVLLWVFAVVQALILGGSLVKIVALGRGGQYVAESLGGRLVNPSTTNPAEKRLVNIVEEMAIASGVPVPMVYVLDNEEGINAFAAGYTPGNAVVAVTKGSLNSFTRDELQGVIGHEFSHILNGDMRLNIRLIGLISGIMILATIGYHILRSGGRSRKGGGPIMFMGLALIIIGYVGVFFARLIQSAVSRQREYLADASSVQFTRNPLGLANALKKIGGFSKGSLVKSPLAPEARHMSTIVRNSLTPYHRRSEKNCPILSARRQWCWRCFLIRMLFKKGTRLKIFKKLSPVI